MVVRMTDVPIIIKSTVMCPLFGANILLTMCRICKHYAYETVDGFVSCNCPPRKRGDIPRDIPRDLPRLD